MYIVSQNVNGVRARIKGGFEKMVAELNPDIMCIQEFRARPGQVPQSFLSDYTAYHSIHERPGYAGASTFVRKDIDQPFLAVDTMGLEDETGRVSILDFKEFKLINAYVPNAGQRLEKLNARLAWQEKLEAYIKAQLKPVILVGDLNVAPHKMDNNTNSKAGTSFGERQAFQRILDIGMTDVFRHFNPDTVEYTFFSNQFKSKENNKGMRIDEFVISDELVPKVESMGHLSDDKYVCGSDHVPIFMKINF